MKRRIRVFLVVVLCFPLLSCGPGEKGAGELCASDDDCKSGTCGFGPCPRSGPACPEGQECTCLVCL